MEHPKEQDQTLTEGQIIVAEFRVQKGMELSEARELIRTNTPSSFQVQEVGLAESYGKAAS